MTALADLLSRADRARLAGRLAELHDRDRLVRERNYYRDRYGLPRFADADAAVGRRRNPRLGRLRK